MRQFRFVLLGVMGFSFIAGTIDGLANQVLAGEASDLVAQRSSEFDDEESSDQSKPLPALENNTSSERGIPELSKPNNNSESKYKNTIESKIIGDPFDNDCDFSIIGTNRDQQKCLGAVGNQCDGVPQLAPVMKNYKTCTVRAKVLPGSIAHDNCCVDHPSGR